MQTLMKKHHLNKAITDDIGTLISNGLDVNVNIPTLTLLKVGIAVVVTAIFTGLSIKLIQKL